MRWEIQSKGLVKSNVILHPWQRTGKNEPEHDNSYKMTCASSEDSDQPVHSPSLIRVFAVRKKIAWALGYHLSAQQTLCSVWADAQSDLSRRWANMSFCWFCRAAAHTDTSRTCTKCIKSQVTDRTHQGNFEQTSNTVIEPHRDKTNNLARAPCEDSDQPGHPPSLIRVFAVRLMGS